MRISWRRLTGVTWRQHRIALTAIGALFALDAVALAFTALLPQGAIGGTVVFTNVGSAVQFDLTVLIMQLTPVLAGVILGAPLLAREYETRSASLTWTQSASRGRWLIGQVMPVALTLAAAALATGSEYWWLVAGHFRLDIWSATLFDLGPLPYAGWTLIAFTLGVFLGALTRRTLPAVAGTVGCYIVLAAVTAAVWRLSYLPPLRHLDAAVPLTSGGSYFAYWKSSGLPTDYLGARYAWPDGQALSAADQMRSSAWLNAHHVRLLTLYQPGSRYLTFQVIELGWLTILSAILIAASVILIRRRSA
jgi:hypothetical protein